jgi:hypothetical protein
LKRELLTFLLCLSVTFSMGCIRSEDVVRSREPSEVLQTQDEALPDIRKLAEKFETETLPQLHLKGKTGREAMDILNQLGFRCTLVAERRDTLWPAKVHQPHVHCILVVSKKRRIYGQLSTRLFLQDWSGDSTPLGRRYDQLAVSKVEGITVTGFHNKDDQDSSASIKETNILNQTFVIATPNQAMAEFVRFAMLHNIACRTTVDDFDHRNFLDCIAEEVTAGCVFASIRIEVTEGRDPSTLFSLRDSDRKVKGKQGSWICHIPTRKR